MKREMEATPGQPRTGCEAIIEHGGLVDRDGKFLEVAP